MSLYLWSSLAEDFGDIGPLSDTEGYGQGGLHIRCKFRVTKKDPESQSTYPERRGSESDWR